MEMVKDKLKEG